MSQVVDAINDRLLDLAAAHHIPVVDLKAMTNDLVLTPPTLAGVAMLGGGSNSGKSIFLSDKFHPGTIVNGILANAILQANLVAFNDPVNFISDQTLLTRAGVPYATPPSNFHFDVSPYVIFTPVPEPSSIALAGMAGLLVTAQWTRKRRRAA